MAPKDYYAIVEGYNNKQKKEAELLRMSVWANKATWEGSLNYQQFCNRFFPLPHDEKENEAEWTMTDEQVEQVLQRHDRLISDRKNKVS